MVTKRGLKIIVTSLKVLLSICNGLSIISGSLLLGVGVYGIISLQPYDSLFQDINLSLIYGLIVGIGIFLSITATTGFCLACNVRTPIVYVHISLLMLSCCAIFSSAIILLFYENNLVGALENGIQLAMSTHKDSLNNGTFTAIDQLQFELKCCGAYSYQDWSDFYAVPPSSCCSLAHCSKDVDYLQTGCVKKIFGEKLTRTLNGYLPEYKNLEYTITSLFTLGSMQLVAAILSCVIQNKVQHLRHMPFSTVY